jgi:hypothetical protein
MRTGKAGDDLGQTHDLTDRFPLYRNAFLAAVDYFYAQRYL